MLSVVMLSVIMLTVIMLTVIMLTKIVRSTIMLSVIVLIVVMLRVVMLSVILISVIVLIFMAPRKQVLQVTNEPAYNGALLIASVQLFIVHGPEVSQFIKNTLLAKF